jgi:hypothetical protein
MEDTRIRFSSLTVHEDEISCSTDEEEIYSSSSSSEEEEIYSSSSSSSEEEEEEEEDDDKVVWSPAHPCDLDSLPKSVLLEVQTYIDNHTNATTAYAPLLKKHRIQVTLWIAHSPRISFLTVHSSGVDAKEFANTPMVVAALDDLFLLRVSIGPHDRYGPSRYTNNYYVYKAGIKPSLTLLPDASSFVFADTSAGILGLGDGNFIIAAIHWAGTHGQYDLHRFDSRTWSWSTRLMHADKPESFTRILTNKVLVIGGEHGLVAWVDLWKGILFCEVLTGGTVLRYCPLPPPLNKRCIGPPEYVRDIAIVEGRIKFFEMRLKVKQHQVAYNTTFTSRALVATTWKMMDPWREWHKDCAALDMFKIPVDKSYSALLPNLLRKTQGTQIALEGLELGLPALSLHEDGVVYIMAKTNERNRRAIVLAVNFRKKVLQGVAKFGAKRTYGFSYTYLQSGISNYLTVESSVSYKGMDQISQLRKLRMLPNYTSRCHERRE